MFLRARGWNVKTQRPAPAGTFPCSVRAVQLAPSAPGIFHNIAGAFAAPGGGFLSNEQDSGQTCRILAERCCRAMSPGEVLSREPCAGALHGGIAAAPPAHPLGSCGVTEAPRSSSQARHSCWWAGILSIAELVEGNPGHTDSSGDVPLLSHSQITNPVLIFSTEAA